jgi:hypothetical protein
MRSVPLRDELRAFWPHYLAHHASQANRALHYAADLTFAICAVASIALARPLLAVAGLGASLSLVTIGHVVFEHNAPLVFRRPLLATLCNARLAWIALYGNSVRSTGRRRRARTRPGTSP